MADLLRDRKGKAALVALILLALSLASTVAMQPGGRSPDSRSRVGHTGLRPDWVRLPPASPARPPTAVQPAPAAPTERPLPAPTPLEPPPPTVEAPVPTETITIAGVSTPVEAPPSATAALPVESPAPPTQSPSPPPAPVVTEGLDLAFAAAIVELANQARLANGLTPLAEHPALVAAAQEYADVHTHVSPDRLDHNLNGSTLDSRAEAEGYAGWTFLAENLVWVSVEPSLSPAEAVQLWLDSPAHRNNMLSPTINETGVGCYLSAAEPPFRICVQDFGARP